MGGAGTDGAGGPTQDAVIELRRYRLRPGARERLIDLFEREFVETQEAVGMRVIGQFRDLDDVDSFVWLRGFAGMAARAEALGRFYGGPVWAAHGDAANDTMINSDDVLLLRPASEGARWPLAERPTAVGPSAGDAGVAAGGLVVATTCHLAPGTEAEFAAFFDESVRPVLAEAGARGLTALVSELSPNTFPRLPVREGETVFVWLMGFADAGAYAEHAGRLAASDAWGRVAAEIDRRTFRPNAVARLAPTARSRLRR